MVKIFSIILSLFFVVALVIPDAAADDRIELKTTTIKGNKELPKILYVVPWKDIKRSKLDEQQLVLHSLFGDLFEPVLPAQAEKRK